MGHFNGTKDHCDFKRTKMIERKSFVIGQSRTVIRQRTIAIGQYTEVMGQRNFVMDTN